MKEKAYLFVGETNKKMVEMFEMDTVTLLCFEDLSLECKNDRSAEALAKRIDEVDAETQNLVLWSKALVGDLPENVKRRIKGRF